MSAPPLVCAALEVALNRYLALEPEAMADCAKLAGRVIALQAEGPGWEFFLLPHAKGVQVLAALEPRDGAVDVRIRAKALHLLQQALRAGQGDPSALLSGVQVEGDAGLLQRFGSLLSRVGFDLEEWLARSMDGAAAHRLAEAIKGFAGWGRQAASTLALDTAEYLREETRDLVHRADIERWIEDVEAVRQRADGLAARLARLERA